uniref:Glycos_transf_2 n=2 Tax=Bacteria TaxID=2 RepID=A0A060BW11_9FUSO|nr:Glycos_transf_2 [uncultured Leptotrichia sp.]
MISVCMATYNGSSFIKAQLESILFQLNTNDEVVISDDGSSDDTLSIIEAFNDPRIRLIEGPKIHSVAHNFEYAIRHSRGDIIFLSDQDDVWLNNKKQSCWLI